MQEKDGRRQVDVMSARCVGRVIFRGSVEVRSFNEFLLISESAAPLTQKKIHS